MQPVVTVAEMRAIDEAARAHVPTETLVARAGAAAAYATLARTGGPYAKRVLVIAGKGHNGDDGRVAAWHLARRGALVRTLPPPALSGDRTPEMEKLLAEADIVLDAAFGTGFRGTYHAPGTARRGSAPFVVAVDIPSGVDGDTGLASGSPMQADLTVTFGALKPGLLFADGKALSGEIVARSIGLDCSAAHAWLVEDADLGDLPARPLSAHKWSAALWVIGGSPGMTGAVGLAARGALRAGAGMVRVSVPGASGKELQVPFAPEAVVMAVPAKGWAELVTTGAERFKAAVVGPGLGREEGTLAEIRTIVRGLRIPLVLDADALVALASSGDVRGLLAGRPAPTVLTPHDGELSRLLGHPPGTDRLAVVGELAASLGVVVVAKGPTTVVSGPDRRTYCVTSGSPALATPGTGDVLAGVIGAVLARSGELRGAPLVTTDMGEVARLAALAAHAHGAAAALGPSVGLLSGDLPELVSKLLSGYIAPR